MKKQLSREEQRLLQENSKRRRSSTRSKKTRTQTDWRHQGEDEESETFERMKPAPQLDLDEAKMSARERAKEEEGPDLSEFHSGLVLTVARDRIQVRDEDGDHTVFLTPDGPRPSVGDNAYWQRDDEVHARLVAIGERRTVLSRPDPQNPHRALVLAANVDVAVVVASAKEPGFRPALIDRCIIAIWHGGATPVICLNKVDLVDADEREEMESRLAAFRELGVQVLQTSTETGEGIPRLIDELTGKTCVLIGHSGVGKSSLLNAIDPERERNTKSGREFDGKGRHTTTSSELVELGNGTRLIDTPGVRSFGLWEIAAEEVLDYFPDLVAVGGSCRYRDCSHLNEPKCAVRDAVEAGELPAVRFDAYKRIRASLTR